MQIKRNPCDSAGDGLVSVQREGVLTKMSQEMTASLATWGPIVVMVVIFYFLLYRPQKKQQQQRKAMLDALQVGNRVMTIGGIYGTIEGMDDKVVRLKIADRTTIEVARASIKANITASEGSEH